MRPVLLAIALGISLGGCAELSNISLFSSRSGDATKSEVTGSIRLDAGRATAMVNAYRSGKGLSVIALDPTLTALAKQQAQAMARSGKVSHSIAGSLQQRFAAIGIRVRSGAENIAAGQDTLEEAMAGWKGSPGHDANLKLEGATRFGIAVATNPKSPYKTFWAMLITTEPPAN